MTHLLGSASVEIALPNRPVDAFWLVAEFGSSENHQLRRRPNGRWSVSAAYREKLVKAMADRFGYIDVYLQTPYDAQCQLRCRSRADSTSCPCMEQLDGVGLRWKHADYKNRPKLGERVVEPGILETGFMVTGAVSDPILTDRFLPARCAGMLDSW